MEASAREAVELASTDHEPSDISDRRTDVPVAPSLPPLDLDTTQVVPKLVLSELRYQARLRTSPGGTALDVSEGAGDALDLAGHAPTALSEPEAAPAAMVDASSEALEEKPASRNGMRGAVAAGVAIGVAGIALGAGVLALAY